jgi:hypothetical protein
MHFSSAPCVLHVSPIPPSLIWLPQYFVNSANYALTFGKTLSNTWHLLCAYLTTHYHSWGYFASHVLRGQLCEVKWYQTTRRNIPEDSHLHTRRRENMKSRRLSWHSPGNNQENHGSIHRRLHETRYRWHNFPQNYLGLPTPRHVHKLSNESQSFCCTL